MLFDVVEVIRLDDEEAVEFEIDVEVGVESVELVGYQGLDVEGIEDIDFVFVRLDFEDE